jgi:hypothetical protein
VKRHYDVDSTHPLADTFHRYCDFFDLFGSFAGYIDFWLLDDLVDSKCDVKLFLPSKNFALPSVPKSLTDYLVFCERTVEFVIARNERIYQLEL